MEQGSSQPGTHQSEDRREGGFRRVKCHLYGTVQRAVKKALAARGAVQHACRQGLG